jgi:hypothetical protein
VFQFGHRSDVGIDSDQARVLSCGSNVLHHRPGPEDRRHRWDCSKAKEAAQQAFAQQPQGDGMVHVRGAGGMMDPAMFGGPSTRSVAADDPIWQPINGISLQDYADLARDAQARGVVTDEAGMIAIA